MRYSHPLEAGRKGFMFKLVEIIGRTIISFSEETGKILILLMQSIKQLFLPPYEVRSTFKQMLEIGVKSLPVVLITAIFTGMVMLTIFLLFYGIYSLRVHFGNIQRKTPQSQLTWS